MRKLTAIIFTDIAGFTALSSQDESRAVNALNRQRELVFPLVEQYAGRCLKEMGDGLLLSFPSSLEAVRCAVEIQKITAHEKDLRLRLGIHQGDVIEHDGDLLGDGVNTAARLEPLAPIGGIVISQRVFEDIASYPEFTAVCIGTPPLKGIQQKLTVYCLLNDGLPAPTQSWLGPTFESGAKVGGYELIRKIGSGTHGQVWLSRSATGQYNALKTMKRDEVEDDSQFDREFRGICHYEPLSRDHEGLVNILYVTRDDEAGLYFYVMELADDLHNAQDFAPESYQARNMAAEIDSRGRLPMNECLTAGIQVAKALGHLHSNNVVHRDIRPSSIIYCRNRIKLTDVSFMTAIGGSFSASGTQGYAPIEGPGYPPADVFSLGKVIYEMATGLHRRYFPSLPTASPGVSADENQFQNALIQTLSVACHVEQSKRYSDGNQLAEALTHLHAELANPAPAATLETAKMDPTQEYKLRITASFNGEERVHDLHGQKLFVGRPNSRQYIDLDLSPDENVSRIHACLWLQNNGLWVEDLGSSYGSKINGQILSTRHLVKLGDVLEVGQTKLIIDSLFLASKTDQ
jgi:serine/threonine protein kinase